MVASVPIGLQTYAKWLQKHSPGSGGTSRLQPKSNHTFKIASIYLLEFFLAGFRFKYFHYGGHYAHRVANLCKSAATAPSRGLGGHLGCNPKVTKLLKEHQLIHLSFLLLVLDFNIFIMVATAPIGLQICAKVLQLHLPGGWGDTLVATQK